MTHSTVDERLRLLVGSVWAMQEDHFHRMLAAVDQADTLRAAMPGSRASQPHLQRDGSAAVIQIMGPMEYRQSLLGAYFGATSTRDRIGQVREARLAKDVESIVLVFDSPGGEVNGVPELAEEVRQAAASKPVTALVDGMAASGAYWVASQASRIWATPSAEIGSIGVFYVHFDASRAIDQAGITPTVIFAGKYKTEGNGMQPLADSAKNYLQERVDALYSDFVSTVARARGVSVGAVRNGYGEGRVVPAADAQRLQMIDRVVAVHDGFAQAIAGGSARAKQMAIARDRNYTAAVMSRIARIR